MSLILASSSPRRSAFLTDLGYTFTQCSPDIDESVLPDEPAPLYVVRLAASKAAALSHLLKQEDCVLAADTIVINDKGEYIPKPDSKAHAREMLLTLSNAWNYVHTAIAVLTPSSLLTCWVYSRVLFRTIREDELDTYLQTGEAMDKSGCYAIQGYAARFARRIEGSLSGIVGLPLVETEQLLLEARKQGAHV